MSMSDYEELQMLRRLVVEQKLKINQQEAELQKNRIQIENLTQAILHAKKKMFGPSSEVTKNKEQLHLFEQAEQLVQEAAAQQKELVITEHKRKVRQPGVRADRIANLPVEVIRCEVEQGTTCSVCEDPLVVIGSKVIRSEVVYEPAVLKVVQYVQEVYKCPTCGGKDSENPSSVVVAVKVPRPILAHSLASPSLVARIMYQKYDMGIPLNRQERDWYQLGLVAYRSTMANWVIRCSEEWLTPIYDKIHQKMLEVEILHGDETRIQCNREPGKKASSESYMWVMRTGRSEEFQAVLFHYSRTRSGKEAKELYEGFRGYLVTDAYAAYEKVEGIKRALCWSHVKRYYLDSISLNSKGKEIPGSKGAEGRDWCDKLFEIERKIKNLEPQEKAKKRQELSRPILEAFWLWVEKTSAMHTTNEALKKALKYSLNQRKYLETFLEEGNIPISNNDCESSIRPFAAGRRAWLFADSPEGATASGIVYSLVETAKLNNLDVFQYLKYLLEVMPETDYHNNPALLDDYMPWSTALPESCRIPDKKKK